MAFVQVNCPNCCAPLDVDSHSSSAKCLYCKSTYIPRSETAANTRSSTAAERAAAELALPRLLSEQELIGDQLRAIRWVPDPSATSSFFISEAGNRKAVVQRFEQARSEKVKKLKEGLPGLWLLLILFSGVATLSGWTWLWVIAAFLLVVTLSVNLEFQKARVAKPPEFPPLPEQVQPKRVQTHDEIRLVQRLASITEEIASHRAYLDASKPSYR